MLGLDPSQKSAGEISFKTNTQLDAETEKRMEEEEELQQSTPLTSLAAELNRRWQSARSAKVQTEEELLDNLRQRNGTYRPDVLSQIQEQGGTQVYMMLTNVKCRAAISWVKDVFFSGDDPWDVRPTPMPDMPQHVEDAIWRQVEQESFLAGTQGIPVSPEQEEQLMDEMRDAFNRRLKKRAKETARRMKSVLADQLKEGGWEDAVNQFIDDVVTFKAGILRGPVVRRKPSIKWKRVGGKYKPIVKRTLKKTFYRVSPFDIYPSPNSRGIDDGFLFERHRVRREDLMELKGVPGYSDEAIDLVLEEYGANGLRDWLFNDQIRADLEQRPNEYLGSTDQPIDMLEYNGSALGSMLIEYGITEDIEPYKEYEVNCMMVGHYVIRCVLNQDPLRRRNYHKACFDEIPGAFWGYGVPDIMRDVQDVCNAAARALVNNMAISSGPQVEIFTDRLAGGEDITSMHPWKIWQTVSDPNASGTGRAMQFFMPDSNAQVLMKVYDHFSKLADEYTGIPAYAYGSADIGGAGRTASGLSMLMTSAARGIKHVISSIDGVVRGSVQLTFEHNMLYNPDESIKGDAEIVVNGANSLMIREQQQIRRNEFLMNTNNQIDFQLMGPEGRAKLLREAVKSLEMDPDDVIPDPESANAQMQQQMQAAMAQQGQPGQELDPAGNPAGGMNLVQPGAG